MNRTLATGLCTLILLSCLSGAAIAQGEEKIYGVYIGGCLVMRLRTGAGDLQLPERREVIQQRLTDLMVATNTPRMDVDVLPASAAPVRTVQAGENYNVYANDMLIVTVTKADAVANKTTVYKQAKQWADRLVEVYPVTFAKADPMGPSR